MDHRTYMIEQLKALTAIPSPSGFTDCVTEYLIEELKRLGYAPSRSRKGNVSVILSGEGEPLILASHADTLGAMVRSIKDDGRIRPTTLGGHQWRTANGENCTIFTRDGRTYTGVVLEKEASAHVADKKTEPLEENMEILVDADTASKEETLALGIRTGDFIAMDPRTVVTESGYIKSRFLDDKLSAAVLLTLARRVKEAHLPLIRQVSLLFTVNEEIGHGASVIPADTEEMIAVDMGCVGADLACTEKMVSICAKDSSGPFSYDVTSRLIRLAEEHKIAHAVDIYPHYSSDVLATLQSGYDIRYGLIGPGVYASHNYERSHIQGAEAALQLLERYITER